MGNEEKTVAVVSHPGNGAADVVSSLRAAGKGTIKWISLPEVHMLGRNTEAEQSTYDYLLGKTEQGPAHFPDGIVALVSAKELSRQLYLASQLIDLRLPLTIGFMHVEEAKKEGLSINIEKIGGQLGVSGYEVGHTAGLDLLAQGMSEAIENPEVKRPLHWRPTVALAEAYHILDKKWVYKHLKLHSGARLIEGLRLLGVAKALDEYQDHPAYSELEGLVTEARELLEKRNENWTMAEVLQRNNWLRQIIASSTIRGEKLAQEKIPFWKKVLGG